MEMQLTHFLQGSILYKPMTDAMVDEAIAVFNSGEHERGADLLESAAALGDLRAAEKLAMVYKRGVGRQQNVARAIELLKPVSTPSAKFALGSILGSDKLYRDDTAALEMFKEAAEEGHVSAAYNLAILYAKGRGCVINFPEAKKWYRVAADHGDVSAKVNLGLLLLGEAQDGAALMLFAEAADVGHAGALMQLGLMHATGQGGFKRSEANALPLLQQAADHGLAQAQVVVGSYYEDARGGLERDIEKALELYLAAAAQGNVSGQSAAADLFEAGLTDTLRAREASENREKSLKVREKSYRRTNSSRTLQKNAIITTPATKSRHSAGVITIGKLLDEEIQPSVEERNKRIQEAATEWAGQSLSPVLPRSGSSKSKWRTSKPL